MGKNKQLTKGEFIDIILKTAPETNDLFETCEPVWDSFMVDSDANRYQIELHLEKNESKFFSGRVYYMEGDDVSLYIIDSIYDKARRRKRIRIEQPQEEWKRKRGV